MALLFWDASALVKRYMPETGRATVNALFENDPLPEMMGTPWGIWKPTRFCGAAIMEGLSTCPLLRRLLPRFNLRS